MQNVYGNHRSDGIGTKGQRMNIGADIDAGMRIDIAGYDRAAQVPRQERGAGAYFQDGLELDFGSHATELFVLVVPAKRRLAVPDCTMLFDP
jgi:hypothetical protein